MPRFVGRKTHPVWWDVIAVIVLIIIVVVVLDLAGTVRLFS